MEVCKCGSVEVWRRGSLEMRKSGNMQMSLYLSHIYLNLVVWKFGSVEVWKCGSVEVWKCGSVEICKYEMSFHFVKFSEPFTTEVIKNIIACSRILFREMVDYTWDQGE